MTNVLQPPTNTITPTPDELNLIHQWQGEIQELPIGSLERQDMETTLHSMLGEMGLGHLDLLPVAHPSDEPITETTPESVIGFSEQYLFGQKAVVDVDQFSDIKGLQAGNQEKLHVELTEITTDTGKKIRYCDLRPYMSKSIQKSGPESKKTQAKLDLLFKRDLKYLAETGTPRNTVTNVKGVSYTKYGGTKVRAYWMPIHDENAPKGVITVARLADCGDSVSAEQALYNSLFGLKLKK